MKYEYNNILSKRVSCLLLKLKQKHFELGDKPEKLLASQLRGEQANRAIHRIKSKSGTLVTNPKTDKCLLQGLLSETLFQQSKVH